MRCTIKHGDCQKHLLSVMGAQLCYIDPPFLSRKDYSTRGGELAFSDKWKSESAYLDFLVPRVFDAWDHTSGSLVLHVDSRMAAAVECALAALGNCASRIIWRYRRWPSKTRNFQRVHDVLLRWARPDAPWNQLYEPLAASTVRKFGTTKQDAQFRDGKRAVSRRTTEESLGTPMGDVWDIPIIAPRAAERTGYPTQKPRALLDRLVLSCTNSGGLVLDPMMGSGSMLEAALENDRNAIGIDQSPVAIRYAEKRLARFMEAA